MVAWLAWRINMDKIMKSLQTNGISDKFAASVAQRLSRREFVKSASALALALGLSLKLSSSVQAHPISDSSCRFGQSPPIDCNVCESSCDLCNRQVTCCDETTSYCYTLTCNCPSCCCETNIFGLCLPFQARLYVCNDGHYKDCCPTCY